MAIQYKTILNRQFEEQCINYQKCCLGGKLTTQDEITARMDTADNNHQQSCLLCYMKGYKMQGNCDTDSCPVKFAYRRVIQTLFKISDALQEIPDLDLPWIKASDYSLEYIISLYEEVIEESRKPISPDSLLGLSKIKNLFGGK